MVYDKTDIDVVKIFERNNCGVSDCLVEKCLEQTEVFHYLLAGKLIDKCLTNSEFNLELGDIDKKLDSILEHFKETKEE